MVLTEPPEGGSLIVLHRLFALGEAVSHLPPVPAPTFYDDESFENDAASTYGESGRKEAKQLAMELSEIFATGELSAEDMDNIMYVMHRAYFQYREQKREQERLSLETAVIQR